MRRGMKDLGALCRSNAVRHGHLFEPARLEHVVPREPPPIGRKSRRLLLGAIAAENQMDAAAGNRRALPPHRLLFLPERPSALAVALHDVGGVAPEHGDARAGAQVKTVAQSVCVLSGNEVISHSIVVAGTSAERRAMTVHARCRPPARNLLPFALRLLQVRPVAALRKERPSPV